MPESRTDDVEQRIARLEQQEQRLVQVLELQAGREATPAGKPRRDWDALAAVIASFIGLLALAVSGYTAYVQREQLRAQVWPRLQISSSNVDPDVGWHVTNQGTGPARVTAMRVVVDDVAVTRWDDVWKAAGYPLKESGITSWISRAVIPPGKEIVIVRPAGLDRNPARFKSLLPDHRHELHITLCYCSVLDDCWATGAGLLLDTVALGSLDDCPITVPERFVE
ncbi:MAG TPA: hypothetical protein VHW23_35460 [Kofleriaceae bacterium]|nr:hypothetical protein [Kofleriaceae bacterium]